MVKKSLLSSVAVFQLSRTSFPKGLALKETSSIGSGDVMSESPNVKKSPSSRSTFENVITSPTT